MNYRMYCTTPEWNLVENRVSLYSEGTENSANSEILGGKTSGCFITSQKRVCSCHLIPRPSSLSNLRMTGISLPFVKRLVLVIPNSLKGRMTCRAGEVLPIQLVNEIVPASGNEEEPRSLCPEISGHLFSISNECWFSLRASAGQSRMGVVDLLAHHMISQSVHVRE